MSRDDLRRWIEGHRAAQRREQEDVRAAGHDPDRAIRDALALIALTARFRDGDGAADFADGRDAAAARTAWTRLRAVARSRPT